MLVVYITTCPRCWRLIVWSLELVGSASPRSNYYRFRCNVEIIPSKALRGWCLSQQKITSGFYDKFIESSFRACFRLKDRKGLWIWCSLTGLHPFLPLFATISFRNAMRHRVSDEFFRSTPFIVCVYISGTKPVSSELKLARPTDVPKVKGLMKEPRS